MILNGNDLFFQSGDVSTVDKIPQGNWLVKYNSIKDEYFLSKLEAFTVPTKIYGDCELLAKRYLNTFNSYNKNLGVALTGLKGTGKSLTAKITCIKSKMPIIVIDVPYHGTTFNYFISSIKERCIIFIDEFEKIYNRKEIQQSLLSLLDGVFMGNKMFLFTSNETSSYNNHLMNRPGRIHYLMSFERIDDKTLNDIVDTNLKDMQHKDKLIEIINMIDDANIDMVIALIREMNDYSESARDAIKFLNIKMSSFSNYNLVYKDLDGFVYKGILNQNPLLSGTLNLEVDMDEKASLKNGLSKLKLKKVKEESGNYKYLYFDINDFKAVKSNVKGTVLINKDKETLIITRANSYSYAF